MIDEKQETGSISTTTARIQAARSGAVSTIPRTKLMRHSGGVRSTILIRRLLANEKIIIRKHR